MDSVDVQISLKPAAAKQFNKITRSGIGKNMNLVVYGKIVSSPRIQTELSGKFLITGFSNEDAEKFVSSFAK